MSVRDRLERDMKEALRAREEMRLRVIRLIRAEVLNRDKEKGKDIDEAAIFGVLQSMIRRRREAAEEYQKVGQEGRARDEQAEVQVIAAYLPEQLDEEGIRREAQAVVAELGASSPKDMGRVMGVLTKKLAGRAPGAAISQVVKELLGG